MYPTPSSDLHHRVVVLLSESSRCAAAAEAARRGQTYTFSGAEGRPVTWLKGEYAGLAVNAATAVLSRCNLKHDLLEESELLPALAGSLHRTAVRGPGQRGLDGCRALIIPGAGHLLPATIEAIAAWLDRGDGRLLVTGPTNLPDSLLGLASRRAVTPAGYTGWRWRTGSAFGDRAHWEDDYVTGYRGHTAWSVAAAPGATALADLVEYAADPTCKLTGEARPLGDAIVRTGRTVYVANQVLELLGGVMQAHLNVEDVRRRQNPLHWGDTLSLFVRQLLLELGLDDLWQTRLRAFGSHAGAFSYRQDVHGHQEFAALDYEAANLIPATFDLEDPAVSEHTTTEQARIWAKRTDGYDFIERGLHNDSVAGSPPDAVRGQGLYRHVAASEERLGYPIYTCGRHGGGHLHPETLDAMDYLYAHNPRILGMCTFSFYHMTEYGVTTPGVEVNGRPITYATDPDPTIATPGFWFPYHAVVTTAEEWRVLRGWDRTHDFDCAYELTERILAGHTSRSGAVDDRLENPVYSLQYHPQYAHDASVNGGRGALPYLKYALALAERQDLWIANQRQLYQRLADWQDVAFGMGDVGSVTVHNPTDRIIAGLVVEQRKPFGSVWEGDAELVHVVSGRFVTVPPLAPGQRRTLRFESQATTAPLVTDPGQSGLEILEARHDHSSGETRLTLRVCRRQSLLLTGVSGRRRYTVSVDSGAQAEVVPEAAISVQDILSMRTGAAPEDGPAFLRLTVEGEENRFREMVVTVRLLRLVA